MGREVRMVPPYWRHPKSEEGGYVPLLKGPFWKRAQSWIEEEKRWALGQRLNIHGEWVPHDEECSFEEWNGPYPDPQDYMPDFPPEDCTRLMMYEDCSEGTPISPAFDTPEELAQWLADNDASAFGGMTASYEQWLNTIHQGYSIGAVFSSQTGWQSGVEIARGPHVASDGEEKPERD